MEFVGPHHGLNAPAALLLDAFEVDGDPDVIPEPRAPWVSKKFALTSLF
jgi:hypothetical protein